MKNRLLLVEGIPGSGKTSITKKIKEHLEKKGLRVKSYNEGDLHPADLAWLAYLPIEEYHALLEAHPQYADKLKSFTAVEEDYALVAYTKLGFYPNENQLMTTLENSEVYGKSTLEQFKEIHLRRWKNFEKHAEKDCIYVFECAYLQNHVNELLSRHDQTPENIKHYLIELINAVKNLDPKLIYLTQDSVKETIDRVAKERISEDREKYPDWIDLVIHYVENSSYGENHHLEGYEGVIEYIEERKRIEFGLIDDLPIEKAIIENKDYNWDTVLNDVLKEINHDL